MKAELLEKDLVVGKTYRGKRYLENFLGKNNNRRILWMGSNEVQYDADNIKDGRHYPTVSIEKFLKWAKEEVKIES